ncbi:hypothetical protein Tdes44962_MAKER02631 [Teratosphaeria destructans]|uniref:Zinc finger PHD-type domain-containing protein n=1 Tax=Teratosphaeria destructans TaxID=418781 RepID=A0A9W7W2V1_9PEZI|nr:hypothetical protein Tdes44962_MAKER02631 [Teratosphaeria destructans]
MASEQVINEHYNRDEYVRRRAGFLDKHPDYEALAQLFPICRRDANDIFRSSDEVLSVQEVQRREILAGIDPLLPLPTVRKAILAFDLRHAMAQHGRAISLPSLPTINTCFASAWMLTPTIQTHNTQTLNSFASYPDREWSPGLEAANTTLYHQQTHSPEFSPLTTPSVISDTDPERRRKPANLSMADTTVAQTALPPPQSQMQLPDPARKRILREIIAALGRDQPPRAMTSPLRSPAASLSGRGMHQPVKQQRGTKRHATEPPEATDSVLGSSPAAQLPPSSTHATSNDVPPRAGPQGAAPAADEPRKKMKLHLKAPGRDTTISPSPPAAQKPVQQAPRKKPSQTQPPQPAVPLTHLEKVIIGAAVAKTKQEAREASNIRRQRLLDEYKIAEDITGDVVEAEKPDLLPEFFNPAAFQDPYNEVRCVCGVTHDDRQRFVGCEGDDCQVWQHVACMGTAVPKDLDKGTYFCQMCDPWAHRELLQELRQRA